MGYHAGIDFVLEYGRCPSVQLMSESECEAGLIATHLFDICVAIGLE